jgi:uncharacterized protein (TIGR02284 family)
MDNLKKILEVLNDLIRINKDREEGYTKASRELTPAEHNLRSAFERKAQESRNNIVQLEQLADEVHHQLNDEQSSETQPSLSGQIYKLWSEVKNFFTGKDRSTVLKSCADGEGKAKDCYESVLNEVELPDKIHHVLDEQKNSIDASQQEMIQMISSE